LPPPSRSRLWLTLASLLAIIPLYLTGLARAGLLLPDEPRYAAIGKTMAATGDWITPVLWGHPWFEKPPFVYWTSAIGFRLGLGGELAPRLPIALLSVAFLVFLFLTLRSAFGERTAWFAAAILSTSAGWLAFSHVGVTDLPMSAFFSAALLLILRPGRLRAAAAGLLLGLAVLSKALVPLVLFLPAVWYLRRRLPDLGALSAATAATALPWFLLCYSRNGAPFIDDLIWKQHFARFATTSLQHVQPFWFYVPVLLAGMFPWSPLLAAAAQRRLYDDPRLRLLLATALFGLVFFSASRNKLPGYLLPLVPSLAIISAAGLDRLRRAGWLLAPTALLLGAIPWLRFAIPDALRSGITHTHATFPAAALFIAAAFAAVLWNLDLHQRRPYAVALIASVILASFCNFLWVDLPELDRRLSARSLWRDQISHAPNPCVSNINRSLHYGVNYYAGREIPDCPSH
jgi:4-amino-4-deoxy-L-arabinose transferase-like glycosyltransferase